MSLLPCVLFICNYACVKLFCILNWLFAKFFWIISFVGHFLFIVLILFEILAVELNHRLLQLVLIWIPTLICPYTKVSSVILTDFFLKFCVVLLQFWG